jgi:hypothetical protein
MADLPYGEKISYNTGTQLFNEKYREMNETANSIRTGNNF